MPSDHIIYLRPHHGKGADYLTGLEGRDNDALISLLGRKTFHRDEYPNILSLAQENGWDLCNPWDTWTLVEA